MQYDNINSSAIVANLPPNTWMGFNENNQINDDLVAQKPAVATTTIKSNEKQKRKQVKNACVNCQKACKKCDDGRPCKRCVKLGLTATCRDSDRKERKKGVKRGPYKKRQAYIKDKPVYPKLTEEQWKTPLYESVPQVLSHSNNQSIYNDFYDDSYCVPSQSNSTLSPASSSSFVDESDETLHCAYGYSYTNNSTTPTNTITTTSSPSASSMLDHHTISGNVTPIQDAAYSWDDIENYRTASPIGYTPILNDMIQFQTFPTTAPIYQPQQKELLIAQPQPFADLSMFNQQPTYWYNNNTTTTGYQQPQLHEQNLFEYSIPSNYSESNSWSFTN